MIKTCENLTQDNTSIPIHIYMTLTRCEDHKNGRQGHNMVGYRTIGLIKWCCWGKRCTRLCYNKNLGYHSLSY